MVKENIEETIKKEERKRFGYLQKGIIIALTAGVLGYTTGRLQEAKTNKAYNTKEKIQIAQLAIKGYAFKKEADPTFYLYKPELVIDSTKKTMIGIMKKEDDTNAGPILKNGKIGYSIAEKSIKEGKRTIETLKEKGERVIQYGRNKIDSLQQKIFGQEKKQYQNELQK